MYNGYLYHQVGECPKTGKGYFSPTFWVGNSKVYGTKNDFKTVEAPILTSCVCCGGSGGRISGEFLEKQLTKKLKNRKKF